MGDAEWVSEDDREAFERDVMRCGQGVRATTPDGKWRYVSPDDLYLPPPPKETA